MVDSIVLPLVFQDCVFFFESCLLSVGSAKVDLLLDRELFILKFTPEMVQLSPESESRTEAI